MSNSNSDLIYDVDYNRIKSVEVCIYYAFEIELAPSYEPREEYIEPAPKGRDYGSIMINDPNLSKIIVKSANDNEYKYLHFAVDQFLKSKGTDLKSFYGSYYHDGEGLDDEVFELIERDCN